MCVPKLIALLLLCAPPSSAETLLERALHGTGVSADRFLAVIPDSLAQSSPATSAPADGWVCELKHLLRNRRYDEALEAAGRAPAGWERELARSVLLSARGRGGEAATSLQAAVSAGAPAAVATPLAIGLQLDGGDRLAALGALASLDTARWAVADEFELAWQLTLREEWAAAIPFLRRSLTDFRQIRSSALLLAVALWKAGHERGAQRLVDHGVVSAAVEPESLQLFLELCKGIGRSTAAVTTLKDALMMHPSAIRWVCLARAQALNGDTAGRRSSLQAALRLSPAGSPLRQSVERELAAQSPGR